MGWDEDQGGILETTDEKARRLFSEQPCKTAKELLDESMKAITARAAKCSPETRRSYTLHPKPKPSKETKMSSPSTFPAGTPLEAKLLISTLNAKIHRLERFGPVNVHKIALKLRDKVRDTLGLGSEIEEELDGILMDSWTVMTLDEQEAVEKAVEEELLSEPEDHHDAPNIDHTWGDNVTTIKNRLPGKALSDKLRVMFDDRHCSVCEHTPPRFTVYDYGEAMGEVTVECSTCGYKLTFRRSTLIAYEEVGQDE